MSDSNEYEWDDTQKISENSYETDMDSDSGSQSGWSGFMEIMATVGSWCFKLRGLLLSIPVIVASISLALRNMAKLPAQVGINLLANGEYQFMVGKSVAVLGPLALTAICLLMMFSSRKVIYPWLISIFSLTLPVLIWLTNVFPA